MHDFKTGWLHAIDPGTANAGMASFYRGKLKASIKLNRPSAKDFLTVAVGRPGPWVRETMQKYVKDRNKHAALNAIEALMKRVASLRGRRFEASYRASQWKGSIPKTLHHRRIFDALSEEEREFWTGDPDVADAIGIGLFALGRIGRGGVAP